MSSIIEFILIHAFFAVFILTFLGAFVMGLTLTIEWFEKNKTKRFIKPVWTRANKLSKRVMVLLRHYTDRAKQTKQS